jgi:hypothetical protein
LGLYNSYYKIEEFDLVYRLPYLPSKIKKEDFEFNRKIVLNVI